MRGIQLLAVWLGIALALAASALAQPPAGQGPPTGTPPGATEPRLPEVVVEPDATPSDSAPAAAPNSSEYSDELPFPSVLAGTLFASPPADGYRASSSTVGTLVDVPDLSFPGTVSVVTPELRQDQQALRFDDVLRDIGGAVKSDDPLRPDAFFLRGFEVRSRDFRKNGFLDPTFTPRDFANVERIEVLKGPASVLYGAGQPSGVVNLVTKKPLAELAHVGTIQFGSFDLDRYTIDSTGPVDDGGLFYYRLNAAYENRNSFRDFGFNERTFVSPVVTCVLDDDTALTWEGEYLNDRRRYDTGLAAINNDPGALPIERFLGEPTDYQRFHDYRTTLGLTRRMGDNWTLYVGGASLWYDSESSATVPSFFVGPTALGPTTFLRTRQNIDPLREQNHGLIANLGGRFETGLLEHHFVMGTEQNWFISGPVAGTQSSIANPATSLALDGTFPFYNNPFTGLPNPTVATAFDSNYRQNRHGFYAQDLVDVGERWSVLLGGRFDHVDVTSSQEFLPIFTRVRTQQDFDRFSPRAGLVYKLIPDTLSLYGMYSRSFEPPPTGLRSTPDPLLPETGESWEGGVKALLLDDLDLLVSGFYIDKQNVTTDRFNLMTFQFETFQVGTQRSQGVEVSLVGRITDRWSTVYNWTYADTRLTDATDPTVNGRRARGVPLNTWNLWTRYNLVQRADLTVGTATGLVLVGDRLGDFATNLRLPGYTRWDSGFYVQRGPWTATLYWENMLDEEYYTSSISQFQVFPGAPMNVRGMVGVVF